MKMTESVSRALLLAIGALAVQFSSAAPPTQIDPEERVITIDGIVKNKSELTAEDVVLGAAPRPSSIDSATLKIGRNVIMCMGHFFPAEDGFATGAIGSYSPNTLTGGEVVRAIWDGDPPCVGGVLLNVGGFPADPGSAWLSSITCNGVTNTPTGATYSYSSGIAAWIWDSSHRFGFTAKGVGASVSCSIVHN